jgi:hypothetical protein
MKSLPYDAKEQYVTEFLELCNVAFSSLNESTGSDDDANGEKEFEQLGCRILPYCDYEMLEQEAPRNRAVRAAAWAHLLVQTVKGLARSPTVHTFLFESAGAEWFFTVCICLLSLDSFFISAHTHTRKHT